MAQATYLRGQEKVRQAVGGQEAMAMDVSVPVDVWVVCELLDFCTVPKVVLYMAESLGDSSAQPSSSSAGLVLGEVAEGACYAPADVRHHDQD